MKSAKKSSPQKKTKKQTTRPVKKGVKKPKRLTKRVSGKLRVGIFGGNFDPFHNGHLNSLETVAKALRLAKVRVIPAFQSPLRTPIQGSTPEQRLAMVQLAVEDNRLLQVDDREIVRGGVSFTINTLRELRDEAANEVPFLIIGMDQFENFDQWQDFAEILHICDLVVTSRPGLDLPSSVESFPGGLKPMVQKFNTKMTVLKSGHSIHFVKLNDIEVSATEIRRRLREQETVTDLVPRSVAEYIQEHHLYENVSRSIGDFQVFTQRCAEWLLSKGALNVQAFDLRPADGPTEFTLIASGTSTRHASALAEFLSREVKSKLGVWPQGQEGVSEGRWVVLDYGALMVHIFYDFLRQEYRLEDLWSKTKALPLKIESKPTASLS